MLHVELDFVGEEQDHGQEGHHEVEGDVLLLDGDAHVFPDVLGWLFGSLDADLFAEDLEFGSFYDFLCHFDVSIVFECYENSGDVSVVLLIPILLDKMLYLKNLSVI